MKASLYDNFEHHVKQLATAVAGPRGKPLGFFYLLLFSQIFTITAVAEEKITVSKEKWANFLPYVPEKNEYQAEIGSMWEANNLYWLGLTYGRHLGACKFFEGQKKCQQYLDFTGGTGGRESYNEGLFLLGLRWQYVSFPNPYSPSFGVFGGLMNIRDDNRDRQVGVYGLDLGYTISLHKKFNVKWENRLGYADQVWLQSMLSFSLKIDKYVDAFADEVKRISKTTVEKTGSALKSTITAPKTFIDWFNRPSDASSESSSDSSLPQE